jgi:hypothetical protein
LRTLLLPPGLLLVAGRAGAAGHRLAPVIAIRGQNAQVW